jgi:SPP1 family predicted phage head-tail adaptor
LPLSAAVKKKFSAGDLNFKVTFAKRVEVDDGYGNVEGDFADQFTTRAAIQPLKGGEGVIASRLTGQQPVIIRVRRSSQTELIRTGWRAADARSGTLYNITAAADMDGDRHYIDIMAISGVAPG